MSYVLQLSGRNDFLLDSGGALFWKIFAKIQKLFAESKFQKCFPQTFSFLEVCSFSQVKTPFAHPRSFLMKLYI